MYRNRKGSNTGMPILAIVGVVGALAGMGVIFGVIGNISSQTGQDHDRRELVDVGAAIENKCTDVSGETATQSVTSISVDLQLKSDVEMEVNDVSVGGNQYAKELVLVFGGSTSNAAYPLPNSTCNIQTSGFPVGPGQYDVEVSYVPPGEDNDADTDNEKPNIQVSVN